MRESTRRPCGRADDRLGRIIARLRPQVGHLVINANGEPQRFAPFGLPVVADRMEGREGPLAGLQAALAWTRRETPNARFVASVAADTPFIRDDLVARLRAALKEAEVFSAIAASAGEADALAEALEDGVLAVHSFAATQGSESSPGFLLGRAMPNGSQRP